MADKSKVGKEYPPIHWEVERGKIGELVRAIGDPNPIYLNKEAAVREGYRDTPAPPTFLTVPMMFSSSMHGLVNDLSINVLMILHGEEEYEYYRVIYPGDVLTGIPKVVSIEEKVGRGKMDMVNVEILYTDQNGEKVAKARCLIVERK